MASTNYRPRSGGYAVSGTSALAQMRYYDDENPPPVYEQRVLPRQPRARRRQEVRRGISGVAMMISLGLLFTVLAGVLIGKSAASGAIQQQINQTQSEIKRLRDRNQALESMLAINTDGELIRNYVVNELGLVKIRADMIYPIHMPDTRPMGEARTGFVQMKQEERGFYAVLANLLRMVPL